LNTTFHICFAFLPQENVSCYSWALSLLKGFYNDIDEPRAISIDKDLALINAIENVFPCTKYIICRWHINGNIAKNLKVKFENGEAWKEFLEEWNAAMYANQEVEFENNWRKIREKYISKPDVINYLESTWISMKVNFVSHWINQYPHLGGNTSSRVESSHVALKIWLKLRYLSF
jgi:hypothetical protein